MTIKPEKFIFNILKKNFNNYSRSQKILAKHILTNYQRIAFLTIQQFAKYSGVSEATIIRFIKLLEFEGYPDFLKELRRIVRSDLKGHERFNIASGTDDSGRNVISGIIEKEIENLLHLEKIFDPKAVKSAVDALSKAKEVFVVGTRASASLACHLSFGLSKLEVRITKILSINSEIFDLLNKVDFGALVILIGFPRYVKELLNVQRFCKEKKIKTVAITDSPFSPLVADINVYSPAESTSFISFQCAPLVLINTIIIELSMINKKASIAALSRFEKLAESENYFTRI